MTTATKSNKTNKEEIKSMRIELIKENLGLTPDLITDEGEVLYDAKKYLEAFKKKHGLHKKLPKK